MEDKVVVMDMARGCLSSGASAMSIKGSGISSQWA